MNSSYFLNRPIFATVISIIIAVVGWACLRLLPVEQYPALVPPMISVSASYPGATAQMVADELAAPLEAGLNGVADMTYMFSSSSIPGVYNLNIFFESGSDIDKALNSVRNQASLILPSLPQAVRDAGLGISKRSLGTLLFIAIEAENGAHDELFVNNYASIHLVETLQRVPGVGDVTVFNAKKYSMRIWLKTDRMAQLGLTVEDVLSAIRSQTIKGGVGEIGQMPSPPNQQLTLSVNVSGTNYNDVRQFESIILRSSPEAATVRLKDIATIELGCRSYDLVGSLNGKSGAYIAITKDPKANAIDVAARMRKEMERIAPFFPKGLKYTIPYDTTQFIRISIEEVVKTLFIAAGLVTLVIFLFLHSIRATLIPLIAMLVSILGTFAGMYLLGFSINTLTLFGMVLAIGIVVDDAIVVVENVERNIKKGLTPKDAAITTMKEVTGPIIAIVLVLSAIYIPVAFVGGIPGQFYKQFGLAISISVILSGIVALTLSPVLSAFLLKPKTTPSSWGQWFDRGFERVNQRYMAGVKSFLHKPILGWSLFASVFVLIALLLKSVPMGLVPQEDQGYLLVAAQLPNGASLNRTLEVSKKIERIASETPGVQNVLSFSGFSLTDGLAQTNAGAYFVQLKDWSERKTKSLSLPSILATLNQEFGEIEEARIFALSPPAIPGIGLTGGFDLWILNEADLPSPAFLKAVESVLAKAKSSPIYKKLIPTFSPDAMSLALQLDRIKAASLGVAVDDIIQSLQALLGSVFVQHFYKFGRSFDAVLQANPEDRNDVGDIGNVFVRSKTTNKMIPLKSLLVPQFSQAPFSITRFNNSPAVHVAIVPGTSDSQAIMGTIEKIAAEMMPEGMGVDWGGLAREERETGGFSILPLLGGFLLIFLILAALYERWSLPLIILLAVPFAFLGALLAIWIRGISNDIFCQVGLLTLIGLSAKNSILIVEFARAKKMSGMSASEAALEGANLRFRAILMTSLTLIFGVLPLVFSSGAGAMSRHSVGTGILGGMCLATLLGIFFVPFFYRMLEAWLDKRKQ